MTMTAEQIVRDENGIEVRTGLAMDEERVYPDTNLSGCLIALVNVALVNVALVNVALVNVALVNVALVM